MRHRDSKAYDHLRSVALFSACSDRELELVLRTTTEVRFPAGQVLTEEGKAGHEFIVVVEGTAKVDVGGRQVATLGPGDFFGEVALLDNGPRTATVTAETDMVADVMNQREFDSIITSAPDVAKSMLVGLARKLRAADVALTH